MASIQCNDDISNLAQPSEIAADLRDRGFTDEAAERYASLDVGDDENPYEVIWSLVLNCVLEAATNVEGLIAGGFTEQEAIDIDNLGDPDVMYTGCGIVSRARPQHRLYDHDFDENLDLNETGNLIDTENIFNYIINHYTQILRTIN